MKNNQTFLVAILICMNFLSVMAEDVTSTYLTNPSFELTDLTGWTLTGADGYAWTTPNTDGDTTKEGDYITGVWNNPIGDVEWSQALSELPNGFYKVGCLMTVSNNRLSSQRLFANGKSILYGEESDYPAEDLAILRATEDLSFAGYATSAAENGIFQALNIIVEVVDNTLALGTRVNGSASEQAFSFKELGSDIGFFKFDAFTLINVSNLLVESLTIGGNSITDYNTADLNLYSQDIKDNVIVAPEVLVNAADGVLVNVIPASSLPGKTEIILTSTDGSCSVSYFIEFTKKTDATLANITADVGVLSPEFSMDRIDYELFVPFGTDSVQFSVTPNVEGATASITDYLDIEYENGVVPFSGDGIDVYITVTALDGVTNIEYFVAIDFDSETKSADLSDLTLSVGEISPAFNRDITTYNALLPLGTTVVTPVPTPLVSVASITSGDEEITLQNGHGKSMILVTAGDGSTKTYTVIYNYEYLSNASFETGDLSGWNLIGADGYAWTTPNTDGDSTKEGALIAGVWNTTIGDVEWIQSLTGLDNGFYKVACDMTVTQAQRQRLSSQRLFVNDKSLLFAKEADYSAQNLEIIDSTEVYAFAGHTPSSAENGTFEPMSIIVEVTDGNLDLGARVNGSATVHPFDFKNVGTDIGFFKFDNFSVSNVSDLLIKSIAIDGIAVNSIVPTDVQIYSTTVAAGATEVPMVTATAADGVKVNIIPAKALPGQTEIVLSSADSSYVMSYFVTFNTEPLSGAALSNLTTSVGTLSPVFHGAILDYTLAISSELTELTLTATLNDTAATVEGDGLISLATGDTTVTITVTAEDSTVQKYTVTISTTTAIASIEASSILVYPTITSGRFYVQTPGAGGLIEVFEISGKRILSKRIMNSKEEISINNKGVYIVKVSRGETNTCIKILKQ